MNVPKLRFKEFSGEWGTQPVGSVCDYIVPGRNKPDSFDGDIPWINTPDIAQNQTIYVSKNKLNITKLEALRIGSKVVPKDAVIISCVGDLGLVAITGTEVVLNQQLHAFIPKNEINFRFLAYELTTKKKYMEKVATRTSLLYMNKENCNSIPISFSTLPEQTKIANFLTMIDERINQLTRKKELMTQYKQGVMQQIFSQQLRFKDDNGEYFEDWEEKSLGDIAERVTRKNKENHPNVLTISAQFGLINQQEFFNKSVSAKDVTNYYLLHKDDFAYNKSYSNGYPMGAIKRLNRYDKGVVSTLYICFRFKEGINLSFFEYYFDFGIQNKEIEMVAQEGVRNHGLLNIALGDFFGINMIVPSLSEQTKIAHFLTALDEKIQHITQQIEATKQYKQGLLQQMFV